MPFGQLRALAASEISGDQEASESVRDVVARGVGVVNYERPARLRSRPQALDESGSQPFGVVAAVLRYAAYFLLYVLHRGGISLCVQLLGAQ